MKTILTFSAVLVLAASALANLDVVTTTEDLASIAKAVGGANVKVAAIVKGVRDPHFIDAKPGDMAKLRNADLFIAVGLDLEVAYEKALLQGARNTKIAVGKPGHLYASTGIYVLDKPVGNVTRADGDVHPNGNPHYWLDPFNARTIARTIADRMGQLDPSNKTAYDQRAEAFVASIDRAMFGAAALNAIGAEKLWTWSSGGTLASQLREAGQTLGGWAAKMEPHRGESIVTYHKSWNYFTRRFGLKVAAQLEPKPGVPPTPGHIADVQRAITAQKIKLILQEPFYSSRSGQTVASRTGAKLVVAPLSVGHTSAAKDYLSLMNTIVDQVSGAL
jgi:zinc/manganese transport system substrate-binding protein